MLAIIPARSGSKGLPGKNTRDLLGQPLIAHTINAALTSECFEEVYVTTDGEDIAQISQKYGAKIIERPHELATDKTSMIEVLKHAENWLSVSNKKNVDHYCLLQPTSPLRNAYHIRDCIERFFENTKYLSAVSVCEDTHSPFKSFKIIEQELHPLFDVKLLSENRQDLVRTYRQNGAIYLSRWSYLTAKEAIIEFPALPYVMAERESIDIDSLDDFHLALRILQDLHSAK